jgi:pimeloyl-ACP methyl ester carboxylesterase
MTATYSQIPGKVVSAANGVDYAYRATGDGTVPLLFLQHFRGNLDNWDPALIDALAATRRVATFDNAGAGGSTGTTPGTVEQMARDAIAFPDAMEFGRADIPGFSIGSFVAQDIALIRPEVVRRLILASSAPQGAAGTHGWAADVIAAVGAPSPIRTRSSTCSTPSQPRAGQPAFQRMTAGTQDRDRATTWQTRQARYDAACAWGVPVHALLQRLSAIDVPVFVANGDSDPHDPAPLLLLARRPDPAGPGEDLPRLRTASCSSTTPSSPSTSMNSWKLEERRRSGHRLVRASGHPADLGYRAAL